MSADSEDLVKEMSATRRVVAICLKRLLVVEEKIDKFTQERKQHWKDEAARRREGSW